MRERPSGTEALQALPFVDVVLPIEQGLATLTQTFQTALDKSRDRIRFTDDGRQEKFSRLLNEAGKNRGGYSMSEEDLRWVYENWGQNTFRQVLDGFIVHIFPNLFADKERLRNPRTTCVGYILDLLHLIDPKMATFDDGVREVIDAFGQAAPETRCSLFTLGAMVDDGEHLRGSPELPMELFIDRDEVIRFKEAVLRLASEKAESDFTRGCDVSYNELQIKVKGFSVN